MEEHNFYILSWFISNFTVVKSFKSNGSEKSRSLKNMLFVLMKCYLNLHKKTSYLAPTNAILCYKIYIQVCRLCNSFETSMLSRDSKDFDNINNTDVLRPCLLSSIACAIWFLLAVVIVPIMPMVCPSLRPINLKSRWNSACSEQCVVRVFVRMPSHLCS